MKLRVVSPLVAVLLLAACSGTEEPGNTGGTAGTAGVGMGGSAGAVTGGQAGALASAGTMQGGASGSSTTAGAPTGGAGASTGGSASAGAPTGGAAGNAGQGGGGPGVPAGCTADPHPICIDFESGIDTATWTGGSAGGVSTMDKAHGTHSYHAYPNAGVLTTTKFGTISNVLWGRFYLRMTPGPAPVPAGTPGAPGGHGNIVGAYEGGDWYELGWQFNGLMGVWHYAGGENPLRSHPDIMDQWYCVELMFDGTKTEMQHWYVDGKEVEYYMGEPNNKKPHLITKFDKLTVGFTSYAGLGIAKDPYGNNNDPKLVDMWLDDIAFDTKRIGCIAGPVGQ